jgi:hypothetical protein
MIGACVSLSAIVLRYGADGLPHAKASSSSRSGMVITFSTRHALPRPPAHIGCAASAQPKPPTIPLIVCAVPDTTLRSMGHGVTVEFDSCLTDRLRRG